MVTKLFTIGDSISQGFMSGAAARTDLSYSTLLARQLGLTPGQDYWYPDSWKEGGLPINLEVVLRTLNEKYGTKLRGAEWLEAAWTINQVLDRAEDYYERGEGRETVPTPDNRAFYHNVAVRGFEVADAWLMNAKIALENIQKNKRKGGLDTILFGTPNASFYRTAQKVLNPGLKPEFMEFSAMDWLEYQVTNGGVEHLCLWLGANNALGTVVQLRIKQTPADGSVAGLDHNQRVCKKWNLYHPEDFKTDYQELMRRVHQIMRKNPSGLNWKVFVGNVPYVSIAPLLKGVGPETKILTTDGEDVYFKYYTYFPFSEKFAYRHDLNLNINQVLHIDNCIRDYNQTIDQEVAKLNLLDNPQKLAGEDRYYVVNFAKVLHDMAWKRNDAKPKYQFPPFFKFVYPQIDTKFYHVNEKGTMKQGGVFSLDGVHPTAIGHGLIAHEFIQVMRKEANVGIADFTDAQWQAIFQSDRLYQQPITLMPELYRHERLAKFLLNTAAFFRD